MAWDFDNALASPLIKVISRDDVWGSFKIKVGTIPTVVRIELRRQMNGDKTKALVSHAIHAPAQLGKYHENHPMRDNPEYALRRAITSLTDQYKQAVEDGHSPSADWLVSA